MKTIQRILVTTDFSSTANNALIYALAFAEALKAEVYILHARRIPSASKMVAPSGYHESVNMDELREDAEKKMKQLRHDFLYSPKVSFECMVQLGSAVEVIERTAKEKRADLIVMGTHRAEGVKTWLGSVTTHTIQHSQYPILVIPEKARFVHPQKLVLATTLTKITHLTGLDMVKTLAQVFKALVEIVHIQPYTKEYTTEQTKFRDALDRYFEGVPHRFFDMKDDHAIDGLDQYLRVNESDIVVTLPQEHTFFERLLHASTTKHLVFHTLKPLLAIQE